MRSRECSACRGQGCRRAKRTKPKINVVTPLPVPDFQPRVAETAPAYDGLYKVNAAPIILGCIGAPDDCRCYTVKATRAQVTEPWCRAFLRREVFYPFEEVPKAAASVAVALPSSGP